MSKKSALIIISPLPSHALPTFYFADILKADGYDVHYFVHQTRGLQEMIEKNQFTFVKSTTENIGYMADAGYVVNNYREKNFIYKTFKFLQLVYTNQIYRERQEEIDTLLTSLRPELVLIDVFAVTNYLFFHKYRHQIKIMLFSPMLSTHTLKGFPILSDPEWIKEAHLEKQRDKTHPLKKSHSRFNKLLDKWILKRICRKIGLPKDNELIYDKNLFTLYSFKNVPELILAPLELEVSPQVRIQHQHYLGLCVNKNTIIHNLDQRFDIGLVKAMKQQSQKIVFCSFGTYFTSIHQHKTILAFINNLVEAVANLEGTHLILASNERILEVLQKTLPEWPTIHLFSKVPQKEVLEHTDVFITHSGLGSIKESIAYGVPMLACPLEPRWDNNGNAFKVEYHGIGLRGEMEKDSTESLAKKIGEILNNPLYRNNTRQMRDVINEKYSAHTFLETVNNLS